MDHIFPVAGDDVCAKCGRTFWITIFSNPYDNNAPLQKSECNAADCPVNADNQPNDIQVISIGFVEDDG